jgi:hypothetical protein
MDDLRRVMEHSLKCAAKGKQLAEQARRLQDASRGLRKESETLVLYHRTVRMKKGQPFVVEALRLPDVRPKQQRKQNENIRKRAGVSVRI